MLDTLATFADGSTLNLWIESTYWLWPLLEILHFMGLSLLLGALIIIDLRMAGHFREFNALATHQLLPIALLGFGLNLVTGVFFFFGDPGRYAVNIGFQIKMVLIMLAGLNALFYYWKISPLMVNWTRDSDSPPLARTIAYASLVLWIGVLLCGRLIPYVGTG